MATLTEQMRDLSAEILSGHEAQRAWLGALRERVGSMRQENRASVRGLTREVREMREQVKKMLNGGESARRQVAATQRKDRKAWLGALKKEVGGMLHEFSTDQRGARRAWQEMATLVESQRRGARPAGVGAHTAKPKVRPKSTSSRRR